MKLNLFPLITLLDTLRPGKVKENKKESKKYGSMVLHSPSKYDAGYLGEYRKMMNSLLRDGSLPINLIDANLLVAADELKTPSQDFGKHRNRLKDCESAGLNDLELVKVLQDEVSNFVMLKRDRKTDGMYVEKKVQHRASFSSEVEFFKHLDQSSHYFPTFACFKESNFETSVITHFIYGHESQVAAAKATKEQLKSMVAQLFNSVVQLHRMGYIHADIKPGNVLVSSDFKVKLIDFGMATRVGRAKKYRGSPYTRAPELHDMCPGPVDVAIDWWAFGATVSIWYYYHYNPKLVKNHHKSLHIQSLYKAALEYFQVQSSYSFTPMKWSRSSFQAGIFPPEFDDEIRRFLARFLTIDPELREFSTIRLQDQIRAHEYFSNFSWPGIQ